MRSCLYRFSLIVILLMWISGCSWLVAPPEDNEPAHAMLQRLMERNSTLQQFKGLLHAQVETQGQPVSGRVAYAAITPNRLRLEWLNPMGQPLTSVAGDGKTLVIVSHVEKKRYILHQSPTVLEDLIHVPMGIEDLVTLLVGRPLVPDFMSVQQMGDSIRDGIRLQNRWRCTLAELHSDSEGRLVQESIFDSEGILLYRIHWLNWQTMEQYTVPQRFQIVMASGESIDIRIDRLVPASNLGPSTFELPPLDPS
jgi:outer membrane biogenesis lipoprotein LolB